ncbi:MAG: carbohydrate kinase family protein [Candidatus Bathyarchaeia archaeon]
MFDVVTIGHFSIDFIILPGGVKPRKMLGGPPTYTSLAARNLDASVSVVSRVGGDFPSRYVRWLQERGVDLSGLQTDEKSKTTSFLIKYYSDGGREMILKGRAPPINVEDLPVSLRARAVHISPIANEVSADLIMKASDIAPVLSLDPQGLLRRFNDLGKVSLHGIGNLGFLKYVEIFKSSGEELKVLTGIQDATEALRKIRDYGVEVAITTMGERGAYVSFNNKFFIVPAIKPKTFVDPTGAGDTFIGAFLVEYIKGEDPLWCTCVGVSASSFVIERAGPRGFGGKREVYDRATQIYEKF